MDGLTFPLVLADRRLPPKPYTAAGRGEYWSTHSQPEEQVQELVCPDQLSNNQARTPTCTATKFARSGAPIVKVGNEITPRALEVQERNYSQPRPWTQLILSFSLTFNPTRYYTSCYVPILWIMGCTHSCPVSCTKSANSSTDTIAKTEQPNSQLHSNSRPACLPACLPPTLQRGTRSTYYSDFFFFFLLSSSYGAILMFECRGGYQPALLVRKLAAIICGCYWVQEWSSGQVESSSIVFMLDGSCLIASSDNLKACSAKALHLLVPAFFI
jgi:hypothetical protein